MHRATFESITRAMASDRPRRQVLVALAGALGPFLTQGNGDVQVGCKKAGKKCDKNKDCCDHAKCQGKKCKCENGFDECGGKCHDLNKDENHCGSCNTACLAGESCVDRVCAEGGCTAALDSCAPDALCITCPDRPDSVCYLDGEGRARCSLVILCTGCNDDADCKDVFGTGARCLDCPGQCSSGACAAD